MDPLNDEMTARAFDFCSNIDVKGFFVPSQISIFMNRIQNIALWESVYVHETFHSILNDCLIGWWIELLEEIANNMFVAFRSGQVLDEKLVSWIISLEFKKRKLCESWIQTQEGFATYFQLNIADIESRAVNTAKELHKLRQQDFTEEDIKRIRGEVERIRREWMDRLSSRNCPKGYWRGYELVREIAEKFGKDNLAPVALAACSVRFPHSLMSQNSDDFRKLMSQDEYVVDRRLELISEIPGDAIKGFPLKDDWWNLTQSILQFIGEQPLEKEFDFVKMTENAYTDPAFPKEFVDIAEKEMPSQLAASKDRWKVLKKKGIDSSQLVSFFNVEGKALTISNFEPALSSELDYISAIRDRSILNSLDKMEFINDLMDSMTKRNKVEEWMEELWGFADLARFRDLFQIERLFSLEEICSLCLSFLKYSNRGITCPHSNLLICMRCCTEMKCSGCHEFTAKQKILSEIEKITESFVYCL